MVSTDSAGKPVNSWTFTMDFTGEQPDENGLAEMLGSMRAFEK